MSKGFKSLSFEQVSLISSGFESQSQRNKWLIDSEHDMYCILVVFFVLTWLKVDLMCDNVLTYIYSFLTHHSHTNDPSGGELKHLGFEPCEEFLLLMSLRKVRLGAWVVPLGYELYPSLHLLLYPSVVKVTHFPRYKWSSNQSYPKVRVVPRPIV